MTRLQSLFILCSILSACTPQKTSTPNVSFYYWKTVFKLSPEEQKTLTTNHVSRLYVRYFDIAWHNNEPVPVSPVSFDNLPGKIAIVPVVYIQNAVMLQPASEVNDLAGKVVAYINQINENSNISCTEIQVDCDWTHASRDAYFDFLKQLKKISNKTLSATIRLHQVKYFERTGIPSVDRGVLMYYNMGHIAADSSNSIYDPAIALKYVSSIKHYPLSLAIALPIFSWGVHIRNHTVIGLVNKIDAQTFSRDLHFKIKTAPYVEVTDNVIKLGHYFKRGDRIKIEAVSADDLEGMASDLRGNLAKQPTEIIFYDLDNFTIKHYEQQQQFFQKISSAF